MSDSDSPGLERERFLETLERLGAEDDAVVVEAARSIVASMRECGVTWNDLLVPEDEPDFEPAYDVEEPEPEEDPELEPEIDEELEPEAEEELKPELQTAEVDEPELQGESGRDAASGDNAAALGLIESLLRRSSLSESLREELEGYREDAQQNELVQADLRYLQSLKKRLTR